MPPFLRAKSQNGTANIMVEFGDKFNDLHAKIREALNINGPISVHFKGEERSKEVVAVVPVGASFNVVPEADTKEEEGQGVGAERDDCEIKGNLSKDTSKQTLTITKNGISKRAVRAGIIENRAEAKSQQICLIQY